MFDVSKILKTKKNTSNFKSMFNTSSMFNNKSLIKGASLQKQTQWKNMSSSKRNIMRKTLPDFDGDRVPDMFDCQPKNIMRQDFSKLGNTGVPAYTHPRSFGYRKNKTYLTPNEYLDIAKKGYNTKQSRNMSREEHEKILSKENIKKLKPIISHSKGRMTIPIIETKRGKVREHEGRHRAVAARELGYEKIPVYFVETDKEYIRDIEKNNPKKANKWEMKDPNIEEVEDEYYTSRDYFKPTNIFDRTSKQSVNKIGEVDNNGKCLGNCKPISYDTYENVKNENVYNKLIQPVNIELYNKESIKHTAIKLPEDNLIVDSQAWQFTTKEPDNLETRKVVYTEDEYNKLGFELNDNRMAGEEPVNELMNDNDGDGVPNITDKNPNNNEVR